MKTLFISLILSLTLILGVSPVNAFSTIDRAAIPLDEKLSDQTQNILRGPKNIVISKISSSNEDYDRNPKLWVQSIYYYFVTRLGFLDVPFNYIVDEDGNIYTSKGGGVYVDPYIKSKTGVVLIGYISNSDEISPFGNTSLKGLVQDLSKSYGVERKEVEIKNLVISKTEGGISQLDFNNDNSDFALKLSKTLNTYSYNSRTNIKYTAKVKSVNYVKEVKSTEKFDVEVIYENVNDFPWFADAEFIYLSTKGSVESPFAINGSWESFSKPVVVSDKVIKPGEELKLNFQMQAKLLPGNYTQKFNLLALPNNVFASSEFPVTFRVTKGDFKLVKIVNIPSLNVRSCIGPSCTILTQVGENQIFIMEEKNAGWYKIKYSDKKSGWVFGQYVQEL